MTVTPRVRLLCMYASADATAAATQSVRVSVCLYVFNPKRLLLVQHRRSQGDCRAIPESGRGLVCAVCVDGASQLLLLLVTSAVTAGPGVPVSLRPSPVALPVVD
jgi:hypothetical protein